MTVYFSITMRFGLNSGGLSHNFCEFNHHGIVYLKQAMRLQMGESNCSRNCLSLLCPSMLEGFSSNIMLVYTSSKDKADCFTYVLTMDH